MQAKPSGGQGRKAPLWSSMLLASTMFTTVGVPAAMAQATVEEIVVTAQKREENLQNVPVSITAIGNEKLEDLQVSDFEDFAKYLPSVSFRSGGPGFTNIYMRGVASGENGNHSGPMPSVGVYLDEQPVTTITGPLDIHVYDMARIEALVGPQGTLYGASSQAGTIRYITNKPKIGVWEGALGAEVNEVSHGGFGYSAEGLANIPVNDKMAVRLVGWARHDAGYIDNVLGTRTFPTAGVTIENSDRIEKDYNEVDTVGARVALKIDLNENWTITPTIMGQEVRADGGVSFDPQVGDLKVNRFNPESTEDNWWQAAMTIEGKIANLDVTYAGAYMQRDVNTESDYSDYSYFYDTLYGYYIIDDTGAFINPAQYIQGKDRYIKQSHELRVATPADQPLRLVAGLFYQKQEHGIEQRYRIDNLASAWEITGWADTLWLTKQKREDIDYAVFGELSYDFTDSLTGTIGWREFKTENSLVGFFGFGSGYSSRTGEAVCFGPPVVGGSPCTNLDKSTDETGHTYKINLTWQVDDDRMIYGTVSTGYRPGGINRRGTLPPYVSDYLKNYELGWKTMWLDRRLRWNGAVFYEQWEDFQFSFLGANGLTEIRNAAQAEMKGFESDVNFVVTDGLTVFGAMSYVDASLTEPYCGEVDANGRPITTCAAPQAPEGSQLPITPKFKGNLSVRYEWEMGSLQAHVQGGFVHQSKVWTDLRVFEREIIGRLPSYTTADFSAGVEKDQWSLEAYIKNAWDERGEITRFAQCATSVCGGRPYTIAIKPRIIGVKFSQKF